MPIFKVENGELVKYSDSVDTELSIFSENPVENKIITKELNNLSTEVNNLKKSVSDGKTAVANAITAKGVKTATDATFDTMANNISNISDIESSLNIFTQSSEPSTKDGIWIKTNNHYQNIVVNNSILNNDGAWGSILALPYNFYYGSAVVYNGEIHILGGFNNATKHYKYNGSSWVSVSTLPYDLYGGSTIVYNGEIHILGGSNNATKHYKYNGSSWTSVSTLPYSFYNGSALIYNGEIHILGSTHSGNYTKHYKYDGSSWVSVSTLPYSFYKGCAVALNTDIYILGSESSNCYTNYSIFSSTSKIFSPYTVIIQRSNELNGLYSTCFVTTSKIVGDYNRFLSGFDDIMYYGKDSFETSDKIYYGNGKKWIKLKN